MEVKGLHEAVIQYVLTWLALWVTGSGISNSRDLVHEPPGYSIYLPWFTASIPADPCQSQLSSIQTWNFPDFIGRISGTFRLSSWWERLACMSTGWVEFWQCSEMVQVHAVRHAGLRIGLNKLIRDKAALVLLYFFFSYHTMAPRHFEIERMARLK